MMNLKNLLNQSSPRILKWVAVGFLVVGFLGFLDASYLAAKYYSGEPITCSLLEGCEQVTTSEYAAIFGVPVALLGAAYYLFIFLAAIYYFDSKNARVFKRIAPITAAAFLATLYFVYLQLFVIGAICIYCMFSALTSTILFGLGIITVRLEKHD